MPRRILLLTAALSLLSSLASPAASDSDHGNTTLRRTIRDLNNDNLLEYAPGEGYVVLNGPSRFRPPNRPLVNFLQLTDFQLVDEESPARVEFLDGTQRAPGLDPFSAAYRPQESLTTQVEEAMVRAVRNVRSRFTDRRPQFTILTGDNADSQQFNETRWFIDILDGGKSINPDSGIPTAQCPATPGTVYDGVRAGGQNNAPDDGYYEPDTSTQATNSDPTETDGDGYSPFRSQNATETGTGDDVTVRDFPGLFEAANKPFSAVGLNMPWYSAFGNHDALIQGNSPDAYIGPGAHHGVFVPPDTETWNPQFQQIAIGCLKPRTAAQRAVLLKELDPANPSLTPAELQELASIQVVPPDPRRCHLAKDEPGTNTPAPCSLGGWIEQHFQTSGTPLGHGFRPASGCTLPPLSTTDPATLVAQIQGLTPAQLCQAYGRPPISDFFNDGYYSFRPRKGLRYIVMDTVTDDCGSQFCSEGSVDNAQFRWVEAQIKRAASLREYVMLFSHHSLATTRWPTTDETEQPAHYGQEVDPRDPSNPQNPTGEKTLAQLFCENRNVLAHIAGHEHENYVLHYPCDGTDDSGGAVGPSASVGGFWHVSTAAHIDWPQQSRMIELIDNGNKKTMSLVLTMIDHAGPPKPDNATGVLRLASIAREISYNDYQNSRDARGTRQDRNVIIVLKRPWLSPSGDNGDDGDDGDDD